MTVTIHTGDTRAILPTLTDSSIHCVVTSPPYFGLRDYGVDGQIGLEQTPCAYVAEMVAVFREVRRVLRDDGTLWLNLGDSYSFSGKGGNPADSTHRKQATNAGSLIKGGDMGSGLPPKNLLGIPWRVAFALQADGWFLRQDIIWHKPNPMPESAKDRCTRSHEYIFMFSKSARYHYDADAIAEERTSNEDAATFRGGAYINGKTFQNGEGGKRAVIGNRYVIDKQSGHGPRHAGFNDRWNAQEKTSGKRNKRSVWTVATRAFSGAHFATFPPSLIEPCILAGCPNGGTVLDPFGGAGTTGIVADRLERNAVLIELNPEYAEMAKARLRDDRGPLLDYLTEAAE